jgi:hypothetical protein
MLVLQHSGGWRSLWEKGKIHEPQKQTGRKLKTALKSGHGYKNDDPVLFIADDHNPFLRII